MVHAANFPVKMVAPLEASVLVLSWELKNLLASLEVGNDSSVIFARAHNEAWVGEAPREREDAAVVDVVEGSHWVVRAPQIPNVDRGVLVIVVGNHELGGNLWVPHHLGFLRWRCRSLLLVLATEVIVH